MRRILDVDDSRKLVVVTPDNYRPDLLSPIGRNKSPVPSKSPRLSKLRLSSPSQGINTNMSSVDSANHDQYSNDFETNTMNTMASTRTVPSYSAEFEPDTSSMPINTLQYSEEFDSISRSSFTSRKIRSATHSGKLETLPTSQIETVDEELSTVNDTINFGTASGRTSRLTWQYSEDFEQTNADEASEQYDESVTDSMASDFTSNQISYRTTTSDDEQDSQFTDDATSASYSTEFSDGTKEAMEEAQNEFFVGLVERLKQGKKKHPPTTGIISSHKPPGTSESDATAEARAEERKAFGTFFKKTLSNIQERKGTKTRNTEDMCDNLKYRLLGLTPGGPVENHGISSQAINKLHLENTQAKLRKMAKEKFHEPRKCANCVALNGELAQAAFVKGKLHLAQERRIQAKLEQDLVQNLAAHLAKDPELLPGKIHTTIGHLDPKSIWNKLGHTGQEHVKVPHGSEQEDPSRISGLNTLCPHMRDSTHGDKTEPVTSCDKDIARHMEKNELEAKDLMRQLSDELCHLNSLNSDDFWKLYFSKLESNNHSRGGFCASSSL